MGLASLLQLLEVAGPAEQGALLAGGHRWWRGGWVVGLRCMRVFGGRAGVPV